MPGCHYRDDFTSQSLLLAAGFDDALAAEHAARCVRRKVGRSCPLEDALQELITVRLLNPETPLEALVEVSAHNLCSSYRGCGERTRDGIRDILGSSEPTRNWRGKALTADGEGQLALQLLPVRELAAVLGCSPATAWRRQQRLLTAARSGQRDFWLREESLT